MTLALLVWPHRREYYKAIIDNYLEGMGLHSLQEAAQEDSNQTPLPLTTLTTLSGPATFQDISSWDIFFPDPVSYFLSTSGSDHTSPSVSLPMQSLQICELVVK